MRIVAILGSPHGPKGATGTLLAGVIEGVRQGGGDATTISLVDQPVKPCLGCDACHKTGTCPQKDGFSAIKSAMLAADGIVLASPNYITSVSAQMKALFDRCCGPLHCQAMIGKYAAAVVTSGGTGSDEVEAYMLRFLRSLGCATIGSVGATGADLADAGRRGRIFKQATDLGRALTRAIQAKEDFPDQHAERKAFFERMKNLVNSRREEWPYEYEHWKSQGWL
jgi:multimeric flavodoxin WrbA